MKKLLVKLYVENGKSFKVWRLYPTNLANKEIVKDLKQSFKAVLLLKQINL